MFGVFGEMIVTGFKAGVTMVLGAGSAIIGKVGIDQSTPGTTNGVQVNAALPAGTNAIGSVTTRDSYAAALSVTRPNDTNAYTAGDVVGAAAAALTFPTMGPSGKEIMLTSVSLEVDVAAIPSGMTTFDLHLYNVTPPSALADNAAWDLPAGDRASYLGKFSLGAPVDLGSTLYVELNGLNKQITLAGTSLFAYLVTVGGYTPTALAVKKVTLHAVAL